MAINFTDFSKAPIQDSPVKGLFENVLKGYQLEEKPKEMAQEKEQKRLANALQEKALAHKDKEYSLSDALKQAQINKANRPSTGKSAAELTPNGAVRNAEWLWRQQHPPGTPLTPEQEKEHFDLLQKAFTTAEEHVETTTNRGKILNEGQFRRDATAITKKHAELRDIDEGYFPGTKEKLTPQKQTEMRNDLLLSIVKDTTDPKTREKLINASNMNITLGSIDPTYLTQYSGAKGKVNKLLDSIVESAGKGSPEYKNYQREVVKATAGAKQMRQYLGDSIQPTAQERLDHLINPEAWNVSPELAKENFEFMKDLLQRETQTLVRAAKDPTLYTPTGNAGVSSPPVNNQEFDFSKFPVVGGG